MHTEVVETDFWQLNRNELFEGLMYSTSLRQLLVILSSIKSIGRAKDCRTVLLSTFGNEIPGLSTLPVVTVSRLDVSSSPTLISKLCSSGQKLDPHSWPPH